MVTWVVKYLVPTGTMVKNLKAARLAADIADVPLNYSWQEQMQMLQN